MKKNTKKPFSDPKMTKCEQPLDKVTMGLGSYHPNGNGDIKHRPFDPT